MAEMWDTETQQESMFKHILQSLNRYLFSVSYGDRIERYGDVEFHL